MAEKGKVGRIRGLPLEPIHRLLKAGIVEYVGDEKKAVELRVGKDAVERTNQIIEKLIKMLGKIAIGIVLNENRKTIKARDIERAFTQIFVKELME